MENTLKSTNYPRKITLRKVQDGLTLVEGLPVDSLEEWIAYYLRLVVRGVRSEEVAQKIALHLYRFKEFFQEAYGHQHLSRCLRRDVVAWQQQLISEGLAPATINNHLASLSAFTTWVHSLAPKIFPAGDPAKGVGELGLPPLEPRSLSSDQVRSLKNLCDRLERFHQLKGRRRNQLERKANKEGNGEIKIPVQAHGRPWRDRAIIYVLLSTGLRREELVNLDLEQVAPAIPAALRTARKARITRVKGKGKSERIVFLSADARSALADYLEKERPGDAGPTATALFLSATTIFGPGRRW